MSFDKLNDAFDVSSEIVSSESDKINPIQKEVDIHYLPWKMFIKK